LARDGSSPLFQNNLKSSRSRGIDQIISKVSQFARTELRQRGDSCGLREPNGA
jgi:hypothetical protein